jgi:hypothetical protein
MAGLFRKLVFASAVTIVIPAQLLAACWQISFADGNVIETNDIWQIHNRVTDESFLIGEENRRDSMIDLANVASWSVIEGRVEGGSKAHRQHFQVEMNNGTTRTLGSSQPLFYRSGNKKSEAPLRDVRYVASCAEISGSADAEIPAPEHPLVPATSVDVSGLFTLKMRNGDVLYGRLAEQTIAWKAPYAIFNFDARQIKSIDLGEDGAPPGRLFTWSGNDISGELDIDTLVLTLDTGLTVDIDASAIQSLSAELPE